MYYGNQKAPASANGQLTFDPNYTLVYHFDGAAGAPPRDTTAYSNHAQTPTTAAVDGVIGRAAQFAGGAPLMPRAPRWPSRPPVPSRSAPGCAPTNPQASS